MSEELLSTARSARERSYSPYSGFPVGAAVLTDDGRVVAGCNVENASYGLCICAERVAIFSAVASGASRIRGLAVSCGKGDPREPGSQMPCGACRQVMAEFAEGDLPIIVDGVGEFHLRDLLPSPFRLP